MTPENKKNKENKSFELLLAHGEGEIGRVLISGFPNIPGNTPGERLEWLNSKATALRKFLSLEPRGFAQMSTNIITTPLNPDANLALFVMQGDRVHAMSGSNSICVATALIESGQLDSQQGHTNLLFETAAGMIPVRAETNNGKCTSVQLEINNAYAEVLDLPLHIPNIGAINVDIAFGGAFFVIVKAKDLNIPLTPQNARKISQLAQPILHAANNAIHPVHPEVKSIHGIAYVFFTDQLNNNDLIGANVMPPGRLDRSPCGTGNSARLACMAARNQLKINDNLTAYSVINSKLNLKCLNITQGTHPHPRLQLSLKGRGRYFGKQTLFPPQIQNHNAPPEEFTLSDTWGDALNPLNLLNP